MSKSIHDDPRITAYMLGELNAAESADIEAALAAAPDGQAFLDEMQQTADLLTAALATEPMPELRTPQREAILSGQPPQPPRRTMWHFVLPLAAALGLAGLVWQGTNQQEVPHAALEAPMVEETTEMAHPQISPNVPPASQIEAQFTVAEVPPTKLEDSIGGIAESWNAVALLDDVDAEDATLLTAAATPVGRDEATSDTVAAGAQFGLDRDGNPNDITVSETDRVPEAAMLEDLVPIEPRPPAEGPPAPAPVQPTVVSVETLDEAAPVSTDYRVLAPETAANQTPVDGTDSTTGKPADGFLAVPVGQDIQTPGLLVDATAAVNGTQLTLTGDVDWSTTIVPVEEPDEASVFTYTLSDAAGAMPAASVQMSISEGFRSADYAISIPSPIKIPDPSDSSGYLSMAVHAAPDNPGPRKPITVGWGDDAVTITPVPHGSKNDTSVTAHVTIPDRPAPPARPQPSVAELEAQRRAAEVAAKRAADELARQQRELADAKARVDAAKKAKEAQKATPGTEQYAPLIDNPFKSVAEIDTSTFSVDVDTAAYANTRRFLRQGQLPPPASVRIEEMINYFNYDYPQPADDHPFAAAVEIAQCPWNLDNRLLRVGLRGKTVTATERPASNLVFLVDVSGSMSRAKKLPLLQRALKVLVAQLDERDSVGIVTYAGNSGVALPSTTANNQETINHAIDKMRSGGSTNGASGIMRAYQMAQERFIKGGLNRVILATDGDFNVGITNRNDLTTLIEGKAKSGVFLSVLGFGMGNLNDHTLEQLAGKGNGNYAYIDDDAEAQKVLSDEMMSTLMTIAKDVKVQMVFNGDHVQDYRLIGYENRRLAKKDFDDDTKDAGEIGAGHTVTALYELVLRPRSKTPDDAELVQLRLRYKQPDGHKSKLMEAPVYDSGGSYADASEDFKFAASVAAFGMLLRGSPYAGNASFDGIAELAGEGLGEDARGYRQEFLNLVQATRNLTRTVPLPPQQTARRP